MNFLVTIVGKTNVGKSTLFNAIARKKFSIAHDEPGVTRDRKELNVRFSDISFTLVDTAGLEKIPQGSVSKYLRGIEDRNKLRDEAEMYEQMIKQSINSIKEANLVVFVVDGLSKLDAEDYYFADIARRMNQNILLVVSKAESEKRLEIDLNETYKFGFGEPVLTSAVHNMGIGDIMERIYNEYHKNPTVQTTQEEPEDKVSIAIIGRPNAGKSTLINKILGHDRLITGAKAGITRDSISINFTHNERPVRLIDTAGVRRSASLNVKGGDVLEKFSITETFRAIRLCNVAVLVIDALDPFVMQDIKLAGRVASEGRNLIVAMNKWDTITDEEHKAFIIKRLNEHLQALIPDIPNPRYVFTSGLTGYGVNDLFEAAFEVYTNWNKRIKTSTLNEWLRVVQTQHPPKAEGRKAVKIKYATQIKTRPPVIKLFTTADGKLHKTYLKFLQNRLAKDFSLSGIVVRFE